MSGKVIKLFTLFRIFILFCGSVFLFYPKELFSQPRNIKFDYLTTDEGISQSTINCVVQDKVGFIWFGTKNGLNRYDGYSVRNFYQSPEDNSSLSGNIINDLLVDKNGDLWVGTNNGLCLFQQAQEHFLRFPLKPEGQPMVENYSVSALNIDSSGRLWVGVFGSGLFRLNPADGYFEPFQSIEVVAGRKTIRSIVEDKSSRIWLATDEGLVLIEPKTKTSRYFIHQASNPFSLPENNVRDLLFDTEGNLWIATLGKGLCRLDINLTGEYRFKQYIPKTNDLRRLNILTLCRNKSKGIWIGTENGGLDYFDFQSESFTNFQFDESTEQSLNNNSIQSIFQDLADNLWVGTYTGGLNIVRSNRKKIDTYRKIPGNCNSLNYNAVSCFYETDDGLLWIGTDGGGINVLNRSKGEFTIYNSKNSGLATDAILDIHGDIHGDIWVSGWGCGLNLFNKQTQTFRQVTKPIVGLSNNNIYAVLFDSRSRCWISFAGIGIALYDIRKNTYKIYSDKNSNLPTNWIIDLKEGPNGTLLLGHVGGYCQFDPDRGTFENLVAAPNNENGMSDSHINIILNENDSSIWIGSVNGLNRYDPIKKKFTKYFEKDGLANNRITGLLKDGHGNIWISTDNGISRFNIDDSTFRNYTVADGLQGKSFIRRSCYITRAGELLFGGTKGFSLFHPDSLLDNRYIPEIVLTDFKIFNRPVNINEKGSPLSVQINECNELNLRYNQSVISFEFAALDYTSPLQNQYAYRLEGFEKDWNYVGNRRIATYTNLDPGKYILRIIGSNNDGKWNEKGKSLIINIQPPYWRTYWFAAIMIFFIVAIIIFYIRYRIVSFKQAQELLEQKVLERTFKLEEANVLLEEKQEEINLQKEELMNQRDNLEENNRILTTQQNQIIKQNRELDKHRNQLETLVEERTRELGKALFKAEESERLKSSFLANMSHEIRTPMNAIIGFSSLLRDDKLTSKERNDYITIITTNGESLLVLINDILDLSKLQAHQLALNFDSFDLLQLLMQITNSAQIEAEKRKIKLQLSLNNFPEHIKVESDSIRLKQVINNLITNAIKFTPSGTVELGILPIQSNLITIYVKDTGIGIPDGTGDTIFERFLKVENSINVLYGGTGLGLSICKSIVELWGGSIWYESKLSGGTTFYFNLPINNREVSISQVTESVRKVSYPNMHEKVILIAEDEITNYRLLETYLLKTEANIVWVNNGLEAIEFVRNHPVDLILMDIKMPGMNGLEATKEIRKTNTEVPIVAQTAFALSNEIKEIQGAGIQEILIKPIKTQKLAEVLNKLFLH